MEWEAFFPEPCNEMKSVIIHDPASPSVEGGGEKDAITQPHS